MLPVGLFFALGASVVWGLAYTFDQRVLASVPPGMLVFLNAVITLVICAPFFVNVHTYKFLVSLDSNSIKLLLLSQSLALVANFFIFSSIKLLGASVASVFEISYPFFVLLFSYLIFGSQLNIYFWVGTAFLVAGSVIIVSFGGLH